MRHYKVTDNGYILSVGTGNNGQEITETEYNEIMSVIQNKPMTTETTDYMLKEDLTWEAYQIEPVEPEPTTEELLNILTGEAE